MLSVKTTALLTLSETAIPPKHSLSENSYCTLRHRESFGVLRGSTESQVTCSLLRYLSGVACFSNVQNSKTNLENDIVLSDNSNIEREKMLTLFH